MRLGRWLAALVVAGSWGCIGSGGTSDVRLDPVEVSRRVPTALQPISFLSGCWLGMSDNGTTQIEERWSPPSENTMVGTTRFLREGTTVSFEFGLMAASEEGLYYRPFPSGNKSEHDFDLTRAAPGEALFEAPEHDYPKRISYRLTPDSGLRVEIDGGIDDPEPRGWSLDRAPCTSLPGT
jgi:hypothetical protein